MNSHEISKSKRMPQRDAAIITDRSYCVNREVVCTLLKFGGNSAFRPSEIGNKDDSKKKFWNSKEDN